VRGAAGDYLLSAGRGSRIAEETWTRRAGAARGEIWPERGSSADGRLACDALGCIFRTAGRSVALIRRAEALAEDCGAAELVVSPVPVPRRCRARTRVIDRFDLWRAGAHAMWLTPDGIRVESTDAWRGRRPWVLRHEPRPPASGEAARS
jgi:competence protein ComEC